MNRTAYYQATRAGTGLVLGLLVGAGCSSTKLDRLDLSFPPEEVDMATAAKTATIRVHYRPQDGSDVTIGLDDTDSLVARGRLKAGLGFDSVAPYVSVGVAHEFLGEASATASGLTFNSSVEGTAFEVGGGIAAWALASNLSLALDAGWRFGDEVEGFAVSGGVKFSW